MILRKNITNSRDSSLIGHWKLDGDIRTVLDKSGKGHHGRSVNTPTLRKYKQHLTANFNGSTNQRIDCGVDLGLGGQKRNITITAWIYLASTSDHGAVFKLGNATYYAGGDGIAIGVGDLYFEETGNHLLVLYEGVYWFSATIPVGTGWHHIAVTIDNGDVITTYLDGVLKTSEYNTYMLEIGSIGTSICQIGGYSASDNTNRYFTGGIREVKVFRRALLESEIKKEYLGIRESFYTLIFKSGTLYNQSNSGGLTLSGLNLKTSNLIRVGSLALSGLINKRDSKNTSGLLSVSGLILKRSDKNPSGVLSTSAVLNKTSNKNTIGNLSLSGLKQSINNKILNGALSFIGLLTKTSTKLLYGILDSIGSLFGIRTILKNLSGILSFTGNLLNNNNKYLTATLSFIGLNNKLSNKIFSSILDFSGSLSNLKAFFKSLTGTLSFSSSFFKNISKQNLGYLSINGSLNKLTDKLLNGSLNFIGLGEGLKSLIAFIKSISGSLSFDASITKQINKFNIADINFYGYVSKDISKITQGLLLLSGSTYKQINKIISGLLSYIGTFVGVITDLIFRPSIDRKYIVASENRSYSILAEHRSYLIPIEDRSYIISIEDRGYSL